MIERIKDELGRHGINDVAVIPLSLCKLLRPYKLQRCGLGDSDRLCAVMFTIPYLTESADKNISSYAIPRDYHLFCKELFEKVIPELKTAYPQNSFAGFADDSPIDEVHAAALADLGVIGDHGLLITPEHSSYVFIGEIITDLKLCADGEREIKHCESCGRCSAVCPKRKCGECLSAITQKKGILSEDEISVIRDHCSAWGCDICSEVCPHTEAARKSGTLYTNIPFFNDHLTPKLTKELVENMSDEDFSRRAYSWRKKETILRNLSILED